MTSAQSGKCCAECLHVSLQQQNMADRGHGGAERDAEDTDKLLYTGLRFYKQYTGSTLYISYSLGEFDPFFCNHRSQ